MPHHQVKPSSGYESDNLAPKSARSGKGALKNHRGASVPSNKHSTCNCSRLLHECFLIASDRLIIRVVAPKITDDFKSLADVGWYGLIYLLTICTFGLFMGRIYTFYDPRQVYLSSLVVFEIGSIACGAAPNSINLIVGRVIVGLGNAGLIQGATMIIIYVTLLHEKSRYTGFVGMATTPLLGGAFTHGPGWR